MPVIKLTSMKLRFTLQSKTGKNREYGRPQREYGQPQGLPLRVQKLLAIFKNKQVQDHCNYLARQIKERMDVPKYSP